MTSRALRAGSLIDDEVAIIRNLLARGRYKNQDILGLINTVRRLGGQAETNGGRISEVKTNKPRYKDIKAASDEETDDFIAYAKKPASFEQIDTGNVNENILESLFPMRKDSADRLAITETDQIECKESFGGQHWITNCIKAIVAFANNKGGYIAFGIKDKTWEIIGVDKDKYEKYDRKNLNQKLRSCLSCGIDFEQFTLDRGGKTIGILHIFPVKIKPVMFIKQIDGAAEGHIYYRYQGENRLIAPAELQHIIEERIRTLSETILSKHISNILSNGIENSAVLNLDTGVVDGKTGSFVIDEELLPKISFIKEGEFVEKSGTPTLKLIRELSSKTVIKEKKVIADDEYPFRPIEAYEEIAKRSGRRFTSHNHVQAWKRYKVRPSSKAKNKDEVNKKFCIFHKAHRDYTYSEAWIDFVVENISLDEEYELLKATRE